MAGLLTRSMQDGPSSDHRFISLSLFFSTSPSHPSYILTVIFSQRTVSLCGLPAIFTSTRPSFSSNLLLPLHVHPPTKPSFSWVITGSALVLWHLLRPSSTRLSAWLKICTGMEMPCSRSGSIPIFTASKFEEWCRIEFGYVIME